MTSEDVRKKFRTSEDLKYFDSASFGLGPIEAYDDVRTAVEAWHDGSADWLEWEDAADETRGAIAQLIGARETGISLLPTVAMASSIALTVVPLNGEVLVPRGEFHSVLFPVLLAREERDVTVVEVEREDLTSSISESTDLVAVSFVHSKDGYLTDISELVRVAKKFGARTYVDGTQGVGVVPADVKQIGVDLLSCACYKWLCSPRGAAFLYTSDEIRHELTPVAPGWRSVDYRRVGLFGGPMRLPEDGRRFDSSMAWLSWVGARRALEVLLQIPEDDRYRLANAPVAHIARRLGLPVPRASILSIDLEPGSRVPEALKAARIRASLRDGTLRLSSHVYNTIDEADVVQPF